MNPGEHPGALPEAISAPPPESGGGFGRIWVRLMGLVWVIFCFELGIFLLIYPWMPNWDHNFFATWAPELRGYWMNSYVRGGVSGLGVVNIYVALVELFNYLKATLFGD